jgi:hypothetical protein
MDLRLATLKAVSFYLLHNVSTLNQCRKLSCGTVVCKHFASYQGYSNYRWDLIWYVKGTCQVAKFIFTFSNLRRELDKNYALLRCYSVGGVITYRRIGINVGNFLRGKNTIWYYSHDDGTYRLY